MDDPATSGVTEGFGLMFYRSRYYDPILSRFAQADTLVPGMGNAQALDRYAYSLNNPIRFNDPSGHDACDEDGNCFNGKGWYRAPGAPRLRLIDTLKMKIFYKYGITMSDVSKLWDVRNLRTVFASLGNIDRALNGRLKNLAGGAIFKWGEYERTVGDNCTYSGWTDGTTVTFYTMGSAAIPQMNIYHEFGHLIDSLPGSMYDIFTKALKGEGSPSYIGSDGYLNQSALKSFPYVKNDMNYASVQAIQASSNSLTEQWADIFANYVALNIDLSKPMGPGIAMYNFISRALAPYIGTP